MTGTAMYVSWGGTGRANGFRRSLRQAEANFDTLVYLAVIDPETFPGLDDRLGQVVQEELKWLLDTQTTLAQQQGSGEGVEIEVIVRSGEVAAQTSEVVAELGVTTVYVGSPDSGRTDDAVATVIEQIRHRTNATVALVDEGDGII